MQGTRGDIVALEEYPKRLGREYKKTPGILTKKGETKRNNVGHRKDVRRRIGRARKIEGVETTKKRYPRKVFQHH